MLTLFSRLVAALESELLREIEPSGAQQPRIRPLENILATMKFTPTATTPLGGVPDGGSEVGAEGGGVLELLPDLSFMSASVLMFPVRDTPDD